MALRDHFRPPLSVRRHWHAFHNAWATYIASRLNDRLPEGYFAEPNVQFGVEIDVAAFEGSERISASAGGLAATAWTPPTPTQTIPFPLITDLVEVAVYHDEGGPTLVGAIELVSPANKDRPAHRDAFVSKCLAYLQQGMGLVVVDVVTGRGGNLHDELLARLPEAGASPSGSDLYAVAYRPVDRGGQPSLDVWSEPLAIGRSLPTLPLWLRGALCLPIELEATYERTCREQRITDEGP
jgi:hypothetical protein